MTVTTVKSEKGTHRIIVQELNPENGKKPKSKSCTIVQEPRMSADELLELVMNMMEAK